MTEHLPQQRKADSSAREHRAAPEPGNGEAEVREVVVMPRVASWEIGAAPSISPLQLGDAILQRWKLMASLPMAFAAVAAIISLIVPPKYTARATFAPESHSGDVRLPGGLAGLATQFGVGLSSDGGSPQFYVDVLHSRTLRDNVLLASFRNPGTETPGDSATLLDILKVKGDNETERLEYGRRKFEDWIAIGADRETGIVSVSVTTRYPQLSADLANLLVEQVNRFNLQTRQSHGRERREFTQDRLVEAGRELRDAEQELRVFLDRNRQWQQSSQLRFQHDRLERQVRIKEQVYTSLLQQYEEARIQELNNTRLITVIDRAVPPEERSSPRRKRTVILAFLGGGVLAVLIALGAEYFERARRSNDEDVERLTTRWAQVKQEIKMFLPGTRSHPT